MLGDLSARRQKIVEDELAKRFAVGIRTGMVSNLSEMIDKTLRGRH